jgi:hypothetical protein
MDGTTPIARKVKVAPARRWITKPRQLFEEVEGRHVAILALRFGEHTFEGDDEATPTADVAVVDVEADPARPVAALSISWRWVVAALRLTEPGTWQVGRLVREAQAVELREPDQDFDLERVARQLGELELTGADCATQLALPVAEPVPAEEPQPAEVQEDEGIDDGIAF